MVPSDWQLNFPRSVVVQPNRIPTLTTRVLPFSMKYRTLCQNKAATAVYHLGVEAGSDYSPYGTENAGKPTYIYAIDPNSVNPADNKLPFSGYPALARPYPVASYHWVWWDE